MPHIPASDHQALRFLDHLAAQTQFLRLEKVLFTHPNKGLGETSMSYLHSLQERLPQLHQRRILYINGVSSAEPNLVFDSFNVW